MKHTAQTPEQTMRFGAVGVRRHWLSGRTGEWLCFGVLVRRLLTLIDLLLELFGLFIIGK